MHRLVVSGDITRGSQYVSTIVQVAACHKRLFLLENMSFGLGPGWPIEDIKKKCVWFMHFLTFCLQIVVKP